VAAHSWGVAFLASQLCPPSLDRGRVLEMCIVHDLAEVRVGDITPYDGISVEKKHQMEFAAIANMNLADRTTNLFAEYEAQETEEAHFVRFMDKLDMALQAERYEREDRDLSQFKAEAKSLAAKHGFSHILACD